jgi:hypothetical protein
MPFTSMKEGGSFQSYLFNGIIVGMLEKLYGRKFKVTASRYESSKSTLFLTIDEAGKADDARALARS